MVFLSYPSYLSSRRYSGVIGLIYELLGREYLQLLLSYRYQKIRIALVDSIE